mmetsp:Transcript_90116/g.291257  ORF Transcript_90116/g.291257 Transcript_90116/m.291257 type:complete len:215 (-) Transcript_90116:583-1227(-)
MPIQSWTLLLVRRRQCVLPPRLHPGSFGLPWSDGLPKRPPRMRGGLELGPAATASSTEGIGRQGEHDVRRAMPRLSARELDDRGRVAGCQRACALHHDFGAGPELGEGGLAGGGFYPARGPVVGQRRWRQDGSLPRTLQIRTLLGRQWKGPMHAVAEPPWLVWPYPIAPRGCGLPDLPVGSGVLEGCALPCREARCGDRRWGHQGHLVEVGGAG